MSNTFEDMVTTYVPRVVDAFKLTFAYHLIMDHVDIANTANPLIITITLVVVTLLDMRLLHYISMIVKHMDEHMATHTVERNTPPSFVTYTYVCTKLVYFLLNDAADIMVNCFAVLIGAVLLNIQPDTEQVTLLPRIMLAMVVLAYFWYVMYAYKIV
jgi:hypothetical protein